MIWHAPDQNELEKKRRTDTSGEDKKKEENFVQVAIAWRVSNVCGKSRHEEHFSPLT